MPTSIHFEGIPGSGKSTASKIFCELLLSQGTDAQWWLEETADHPIMPQEQRRQAREPDFADSCLAAWSAFLASLNNVAVLDGYAFQSTVRFLFQNLVDRREIDKYFDQWQHIAGDSAIVFLAVEDPTAHFDLVCAERGANWTAKLLEYVAQTEYGKANGLRGRTGFVVFWSHYQELCQELIDAATLPVETIKSRSWDTTSLEQLQTWSKLTGAV